ncbi:MAG: hypothetical protein ACRD5H_14780 [Nitrososphaerales archaeon]
MMNKSKNRILRCFAYRLYRHTLALTCLALCCVAQTPQSLQNIDSRTFDEVKKKEGWLTPEVRNLPKTTLISEILLDGQLVKITPLDIPKETPGNFDQYWLDEGNLHVHSFTASMHTISSYEHEKKIFAYRVTYTPYVVGEYGKTYIGMIWAFYYYDDDGDGIFETRRPDKLGALFLPKWVKSPR